MKGRLRAVVSTTASLSTISLLAACASGPSGPTVDQPFYGTITSRAARHFTTTAGSDSAPQMLVENPPGVWSISHQDCDRAAWFTISGVTKVTYDGQSADTSWLTVGRRVAVRSDGNVLESCPPQTGATEVMLLFP